MIVVTTRHRCCVCWQLTIVRLSACVPSHRDVTAGDEAVRGGRVEQHSRCFLFCVVGDNTAGRVCFRAAAAQSKLVTGRDSEIEC